MKTKLGSVHFAGGDEVEIDANEGTGRGGLGHEGPSSSPPRRAGGWPGGPPPCVPLSPGCLRRAEYKSHPRKAQAQSDFAELLRNAGIPSDPPARWKEK